MKLKQNLRCQSSQLSGCCEKQATGQDKRSYQSKTARKHITEAATSKHQVTLYTPLHNANILLYCPTGIIVYIYSSNCHSGFVLVKHNKASNTMWEVARYCRLSFSGGNFLAIFGLWKGFLSDRKTDLKSTLNTPLRMVEGLKNKQTKQPRNKKKLADLSAWISPFHTHILCPW